MALTARDIVFCVGQKGLEHIILKGISLNICRGDVVGIYGDEKSGKTILAAILSGAINPQNGVINYVKNVKVQKGLLTPNKLKRRYFGLRRNIKIYKHLQECKSHKTDILIIDDVDEYLSCLPDLIISRSRLNVTTILTSRKYSILTSLCNKIYKLEHGRLVNGL